MAKQLSKWPLKVAIDEVVNEIQKKYNTEEITEVRLVVSLKMGGDRGPTNVDYEVDFDSVLGDEVMKLRIADALSRRWVDRLDVCDREREMITEIYRRTH